MAGRAENFGDLVEPESFSAESLGIQRVGRGSGFTKTPASSNSKNQWSRSLRDRVASNYQNTYDRAPENLRRMGEQFFPNWNIDAQHIASILGGGATMEHGAALLAHLSPSNEAELNRIQAVQLATSLRDETLKPRHIRAIEEAALHSSRATGLEASSRSATGAEKQRLLSERERVLELGNDARRRTGLEGTPFGAIGSRELHKAVSSIGSDNPLETLRNSQGQAMKIYHFGHNIADYMNYSHPTIDTHAHDAGLGRVDIPYEVKRGLESMGRVGAFQDSMIRAHARYTDRTGSDVPISGFMGGLWFPHLQRKVFYNEDANSARKAADTKLANIHSDPANRLWLPGQGEHSNIRPSFGKIQTR